MAQPALRLKGYDEFLRACRAAGRQTEREVRSTFRKVGDIVKVDAASRFERYHPKSAAGYRTIVRQRGVSVEQSLRKTTGNREDFGRLQMRKALIPAGEAKRDEVVREMEQAVENIAEYFSLVARWRGSGLLSRGPL